MEQNLELQLSEVEMIQAMYPEKGAVVLDNVLILQDVRNYLDQQGPAPANVAFTVKLGWIEQDNSVEEDAADDPIMFELHCNLPREYPNISPELFVRCDILRREEQKDLNIKLTEYANELINLGELCIVPTLQWIQGNLSSYIDSSLVLSNKSSAKEPVKPEGESKLSRLLLYMHHIYSKTKRKVIVEWAEELKLTGKSYHSVFIIIIIAN